MKTTNLENLFEIIDGKYIDRSNLVEKEKEVIPYLRPTSNINNLIVGYVERTFLLKDNIYRNRIMVSTAGEGSHTYSYFIDYEFCSSNNTCVLLEKEKMSEIELILYAKYITLNRYKYSYGRSPNNNRLKKLKIPKLSEIKRMIKENKLTIEMLEDSKIKGYKLALNEGVKEIKLKTSEWKVYTIEELFEVSKGARHNQNERIDGNIPFLTATSINNGVSSMISNENFKKMDVVKNKITVDMFNNVFYSPYEFLCDDNVHIISLKNGMEFNKYSAFFLISIINKEKYKYGFGRQLRLKNFNKIKIKLPSSYDQKSNKYEPDWNYMETYIKSLPFSISI